METSKIKIDVWGNDVEHQLSDAQKNQLKMIATYGCDSPANPNQQLAGLSHDILNDMYDSGIITDADQEDGHGEDVTSMIVEQIYSQILNMLNQA